ncbi:MAG: beta-ketoacyl-ACP synthase [Rhodospirillaceae bacterium]|jgi:3-oxoacyl-[acyl-carrier-protein] synthase II|nr:beta-ketoacyl-ACP synthase [Rhodospirillaceae bacterium]MBT4042338.1 beta-ketoacyl-ACP synthase [Rhodospirillaceae bacterium]MBT5523076.1 beta-ketoacyl-ACP synthase [Rhodospirillaceae bacterium]MBT6825735.1 beta-ketoacyl-ACP synthase [Rhodospirillales bacterium]MBT6986791.1 beta-ketoacyl-ACP synthase [Rhodospirillaceae bacterium]
MSRRVVITGMGGISALGHNWSDIRANMAAGRTATRRMADWDEYDIQTKLGAPVLDFDGKSMYPRKRIRTMGPVSLMAVRATEKALEDAGLDDDPVLNNGRTGIAYGSSWGSIDPLAAFGELLNNGKSRKLTSTSYVQMMSHTAAVNIGLFFKVTGRIIPTSCACASGSQGIGYAYEAIKCGFQDIMIAGGAEELSVADSAVFDTLFAASTLNDSPELSPRPFDRDRDGLVIGEGSTTLILEDYEHARARGAHIHAEVMGFATNSDGSHITQPQASTMELTLRGAMDDAGIPGSEIGFVSAHGTATDFGDVAESLATRAAFDRAVPTHSLKSYFGHTLGACGAIEAWLAIEMARDGWFPPTANLVNVDPECGDLDYIMETPRQIETEFVMSNNFAFGGINTSLIFKLPG